MNSTPNCIYCGHPLKVTSATASICTACGIVEFCDPGVVQQLHLKFQPQQQQQPQGRKEKKE